MHYVPPQLLLCILQGMLYGSTQVNTCKHFNDEGHNNRRTLLPDVGNVAGAHDFALSVHEANYYAEWQVIPLPKCGCLSGV